MAPEGPTLSPQHWRPTLPQTKKSGERHIERVVTGEQFSKSRDGHELEMERTADNGATGIGGEVVRTVVQERNTIYAADMRIPLQSVPSPRPEKNSSIPVNLGVPQSLASSAARSASAQSQATDSLVDEVPPHPQASTPEFVRSGQISYFNVDTWKIVLQRFVKGKSVAVPQPVLNFTLYKKSTF